MATEDHQLSNSIKQTDPYLCLSVDEPQAITLHMKGILKTTSFSK
jgi:hypothetical protein